MEESELDYADAGYSDAVWSGDVPVIPTGATSLPRSVPSATGSKGGKESSQDIPTFTSSGRHILYCGTDLLVDGAQFHTSPRKHSNQGILSRSADASGSLNSYMQARIDSRNTGGRVLGSQPGCSGEGKPNDGPETKRIKVAVDDQGRTDGSGVAQDEQGEDDVLEVETDTPGGYHVSAVLTHHRDSTDPEEYIVEAHVHP